MSNPPKPQTYRSFLLRLWVDGDSKWRFSLENPHTDERHGFADFDHLSDFLKEVMEQSQDNSSGQPSV